MATVTVVNSKSKGGGNGLRRSLQYISQDRKAMLEDGRRLVSGVNCLPDTAYIEFLTTKRSFDKTDGRQFYHFVQSFHPDENTTPEQVHRIGLEFAEKRFPNFEVVVATHTDAEHLHNHLIVNSVSFETGKKLHQSQKDLHRHREVSDEICVTHGLTILPLEPAQRELKGLQQREYRAAAKGDSWKFRLMNAIDHCMNRSYSKLDFIENMRQMGYGVAWSDTRKYITYTCPNGMKCRDNRLHDNKYLKEMMQIEFGYRQIERAEPAGAGQALRTVPAQNIRNPGEELAGVSVSDAREPAPAAGSGGGNPPQFHRAESEREGSGSSIDADRAVKTGWESSRQELENPVGTGSVDEQTTGRVPQVNQDMALDGLRLAGNIAGLARGIGKMSDEPIQPPKPKIVRERKRAIGQKRDDHEQEHGISMSI